MTATQRLIDAWQEAVGQAAQLSPAALAGDVALSLVIVAGAWTLAYVAGRFLRALSSHLPGPPTADKMVRSSRLARLLDLVVRVALAAAAAILVASVWGFDVIHWATTGIGGRVAGVVAQLTLLLVGAAVAVETTGFIIGRAMRGVAQNAADPRRKAQLQTLHPLLLGAAQIAIIVVAAVMALGEIGVQIGPLLAGAGVVGVALGFGAQTIVKDLLTGIFLILEDIVSVGDVVRIGDSGGLVERMTLRTIRLRDFDGTLHVFPYGEAQVVHNLTKSFSYSVFNLQISYGSDIDKALRIMREVGDGMRHDEAFADKILEPIEVVGVDNLADSGVVLKARIKTKPIQQWAVGREYNRRIKLAFEGAGVEIPFPHMKLVLPDKQLSRLATH